MNANVLTINPKKSVALIVSPNSNQKEDLQILINSSQIPNVQTTKYLGIEIDNDLSFSNHTSILTTKLSRLTGIFWKMKNYLTKDVLLKLYYALLYPHITYGIVLWGATPNAQLSRLKTIQNKIIKIIGGGEWRERATPYYLQLDILKLDDVYKLEVGKLMFHNNKNNLPKPFEGYFTEAGMNHLHQTRASSQKLLKVCRFSKSRYQQSFKYQGVSIWNSIPNNIKQHSFFSFKKKYKKMLIDSYNQ